MMSAAYNNAMLVSNDSGNFRMAYSLQRRWEHGILFLIRRHQTKTRYVRRGRLSRAFANSVHL